MTEEKATFGGLWDASDSVDEQLSAMLAAVSGPVNWRVVAAADARDHWDALREWVEWFRLDFAYDHRVIPPCWYQHRALVHLLSAIRDHWTQAYDAMSTPSAASEWHRALTVLEPRLRDWASRTGCASGVHRGDLLADYPDDDAEWTAHVDHDIALRRRDEQRNADQRIDARTAP